MIVSLSCLGLVVGAIWGGVYCFTIGYCGPVLGPSELLLPALLFGFFGAAITGTALGIVFGVLGALIQLLAGLSITSEQSEVK